MHVCVCRVGVRWEGWEGWEKISTLHSYQLPHSVMSWKFPCIDLLFKCLTSKFYPDLVFWVIIYVQFLYKAMNSLHCVPTWHLCTWMCVCSMNLTNQNFKIKCYVYHEPQCENIPQNYTQSSHFPRLLPSLRLKLERILGMRLKTVVEL